MQVVHERAEERLPNVSLTLVHSCNCVDKVVCVFFVFKDCCLIYYLYIYLFVVFLFFVVCVCDSEVGIEKERKSRTEKYTMYRVSRRRVD